MCISRSWMLLFNTWPSRSASRTEPPVLEVHLCGIGQYRLRLCCRVPFHRMGEAILCPLLITWWECALSPLQAVVKNVAVNTGVALFEHLLPFLGCLSRSGISGSWGNSVFNLWRNCQSVFASSCTVYLPSNTHESSCFPASLLIFFLAILSVK